MSRWPRRVVRLRPEKPCFRVGFQGDGHGNRNQVRRGHKRPPSDSKSPSRRAVPEKLGLPGWYISACQTAQASLNSLAKVLSPFAPRVLASWAKVPRPPGSPGRRYTSVHTVTPRFCGRSAAAEQCTNPTRFALRPGCTMMPELEKLGGCLQLVGAAVAHNPPLRTGLEQAAVCNVGSQTRSRTAEEGPDG